MTSDGLTNLMNDLFHLHFFTHSDYLVCTIKDVHDTKEYTISLDSTVGVGVLIRLCDAQKNEKCKFYTWQSYTL